MLEQDAIGGPWVDALAAILAERWNGAGDAAEWTFTYAEIGRLLDQFPGTPVQIEGGESGSGGVIHLRVQLTHPAELPTRPHADGHGRPHLLTQHLRPYIVQSDSNDGEATSEASTPTPSGSGEST